MLSNIEGKAWKFGNDIDTDIICAGRFMNSPLAEMRQHVFEAIRPEFASSVKPGDIILAGTWFGSGSSRETAPAALKALGLGAVVAESFSRNFYRNAFGIGFPVIACKGAHEAFTEGALLSISFKDMRVTDLGTGKNLSFEPFPDEMLQVLEAGGIENLLRQMRL